MQDRSGQTVVWTRKQVYHDCSATRYATKPTGSYEPASPSYIEKVEKVLKDIEKAY